LLGCANIITGGVRGAIQDWAFGDLKSIGSLGEYRHWMKSVATCRHLYHREEQGKSSASKDTKRSCTVWSCNYLSCTIFLFVFDPYLYAEKKSHLLIQPSFCHHSCAFPVGSYSISFPNPMSYLVLPAGASLSILLPSHQIVLSHSMQRRMRLCHANAVSALDMLPKVRVPVAKSPASIT